jgi:hypothetical protein
MAVHSRRLGSFQIDQKAAEEWKMFAQPSSWVGWGENGTKLSPVFSVQNLVGKLAIKTCTLVQYMLYSMQMQTSLHQV